MDTHNILTHALFPVLNNNAAPVPYDSDLCLYNYRAPITLKFDTPILVIRGYNIYFTDLLKCNRKTIAADAAIFMKQLCTLLQINQSLPAQL